jgi:hypothetical protein
MVAAVAALVLALAISSACTGDDAGDDEPADVATSSDGGRTAAPERTSRATATPEDDGEGDVPTFEAGEWTGGEATVNVSGADTRTVTGTLSTESSTDGGTTRLIYTNDLDTINFSISTEFMPFDMTVSQEGFRARRPLDAEPCAVAYAEASDARIEGTFRCEGQIERGPADGAVTLEGSFTATR